MKHKQTALFEKKTFPLASHGRPQQMVQQSPYTYDTPQQPKSETNLKPTKETYNRGIVPADHNNNPFGKKDRALRFEQHKMETAMRIAKNKKFSENRKKALEANDYQPYIHPS